MASESNAKKRFSLIELIMLIMVVGIIMTFAIPLQQAKKREGWTKAAVTTIQDIAAKNAAFKAKTGHYTAALDSLQVTADTTYFTFSMTAETITGTTTKAYGVEGVELRFELPSGPWHMVAKDEKDKYAIQPNWLPE